MHQISELPILGRQLQGLRESSAARNKKAAKPHGLKDVVSSETALWKGGNEITKLGLRYSLGLQCTLKTVGEADEKAGVTLGSACGGWVEVPFPHLCHTRQDGFLAVSPLL